jgi:release factor glutamine methyltransferase
MADLGTGTGCIAISLAAEIAGCRVAASDVSRAALDVAQRNAARHGVAERVEFIEGPGLVPLREAGGGRLYDAICSNPPYIPDGEWAEVGRMVRDFEPREALRGGPDGLEVIRPLIRDAAELLRPGGLLAIEIPQSRQDAVLELAQGHGGYVDAQISRDHEGHWRVLTARRAER